MTNRALRHLGFVLLTTSVRGWAGDSSIPDMDASHSLPRFDRVLVDPASPKDPWMKAVADLNDDGLPDLIVAGAKGPIVWYEAPNWTKRVLAETADSESGSAAADLDGDGDQDLVVGTTWYENRDHGQTWIAHPLPDPRAGTHDIVIADLDHDGRPDIVMRGETKSVVHAFLQTRPGEWSEFAVDPGIGLNGLAVADLNGDGRPDIVVGGVWLENPGAPFAGKTWAPHEFARGWNPYASVKVADIDHDGRPDIVLSVSESIGKVSWFKAPADPRSGPWPETVIAENLTKVHAIFPLDLDRDGRLDVVASEYEGAGRLLACLQRGDHWEAHELGRDSLHNICAADLGANGNIDFFGVNAWGVKPVMIYQNIGRAADQTKRILVFSRTLGFRHESIPDGIAAIKRLGAGHGFAVDATEDSSVFTAARLARYCAVVFLNPSGDILNAEQRAAFQHYIESGHGFVGVHNAAALVLEDWDWYTGLVGARYQTEISTQPSRVSVTNPMHISTENFPATWSAPLESYNFRRNPKQRGAIVLLNLDESSVRGGTMGADHPFSWFHPYDGGRAWYTSAGANPQDYADPVFLDHLLGGIRYAGDF